MTESHKKELIDFLEPVSKKNFERHCSKQTMVRNRIPRAEQSSLASPCLRLPIPPFGISYADLLCSLRQMVLSFPEVLRNQFPASIERYDKCRASTTSSWTVHWQDTCSQTTSKWLMRLVTVVCSFLCSQERSAWSGAQLPMELVVISITKTQDTKPLLFLQL